MRLIILCVVFARVSLGVSSPLNINNVSRDIIFTETRFNTYIFLAPQCFAALAKLPRLGSFPFYIATLSPAV